MSTNPAFALAFRTSPWKEQLGHAWDYGFDELLFELHGDALRVRFLDDAAECDPAQMVRALQDVEERRIG